jgi:hypothetical protein
VLTEPLPLVLMDSVKQLMKLAVIFLFPFIVTEIGFVDPDASPVQFVNTLPDEGFAVRVTPVPLVYLLPSHGQFGAGELLTVPNPGGLILIGKS